MLSSLSCAARGKAERGRQQGCRSPMSASAAEHCPPGPLVTSSPVSLPCRPWCALFLCSCVAVARKAFDEGEWPRMSGKQRGKVMLKLAELIEANADEMAGIESLDNGEELAVGGGLVLAAAQLGRGSACLLHSTCVRPSVHRRP